MWSGEDRLRASRWGLWPLELLKQGIFLEPKRKGLLQGFHDAFELEIDNPVQTPGFCLCPALDSVFPFFESENLIA